MRPIIPVIFLIGGIACTAEQTVEQFEGLKTRYAGKDTVEFRIVNPSTDTLFYWVQLEMRGDDGWYLVYSSLAGLRNDMSEPEISTTMPGQTVTITWVPDADEVFRVRNQRGQNEYRLVLRTVHDPREEATSATPSMSFQIG
jgi:hypothetical protein